jgi:hypothetical protein
MLLIESPTNRPRVYYGRQADGLEAALPGSPEGETIDQVGAINVAGALGRGRLAMIAPRQLYDWKPEIVIAERRGSYDALRGLPAIQHKRVYLAPAYLFGWIDDPPGVNRLIGLHWLSSLFYPDENQEDLRSAACEFYDLFYGIKLTNAQIDAMLQLAGVQSPETGEAIPRVGARASTAATPSTPTTPSLAKPANPAMLTNPTTLSTRSQAGGGGGTLPIRGTADKQSGLPATGNQPGDMWLVLNPPPTHLWAWAGTWVNAGAMATGPQGPSGLHGPLPPPRPALCRGPIRP